MKIAKVARGLLIFGIVLLAVGLLWPFIYPPGKMWDNARAAELTQASESLHSILHEHGHAHNDESFHDTHAAEHDPEVAAASERYHHLQAELDTAHFWGESAPAYLRWSGLALCGVGVVAYFGSRRE